MKEDPSIAVVATHAVTPVRIFVGLAAFLQLVSKYLSCTQAAGGIDSECLYELRMRHTHRHLGQLYEKGHSRYFEYGPVLQCCDNNIKVRKLGRDRSDEWESGKRAQ
jgi:hypothetical protein